MFDRSPKLSLCNATGISNEDVSELQNELRRMAANLVGEVRCTCICAETGLFYYRNILERCCWWRGRKVQNMQTVVFWVAKFEA